MTNVFSVPVGASFPEAFVEGFLDRFGNRPPHEIAAATIVVNTARMQRRIRECFAANGPMLLPQIRTLAQLGDGAGFADIPAAISPIRRRLDIARLTAALIERDPSVAPRESAFSLADELVALLDELHGEGVSPDDLKTIDISNVSEHWERSLRFFEIVSAYVDEKDDRAPGPEERQREIVERLCARLERDPPSGPLIVAGSTGSRGTTSLLMRTVAQLPNGFVVLPGFDTDLDEGVWDSVANSSLGDHPQYRFAAFMKSLNLRTHDVGHWAGQPVDANRNRFISMALRPAPVTSAWIAEGPNLGALDRATSTLSLIEARSQRLEAAAIAFVIRDSIEQGRPIALISPDRHLTRRVSASLDRWGIEPDDSGGRPLALSAPGRFLRQTARLIGERTRPDELIALLAHPLAATGGDRGAHVLRSREFELWLRRNALALIEPQTLTRWQTETEGLDADWFEWLSEILNKLQEPVNSDLPGRIGKLMELAEQIAAGVGASGSGALWEKNAGESAFAVMADLAAAANTNDSLDNRAFGDLLDHVLNAKEVREPISPNENVLIWGTLEARVQGTDTVILGSLNEGTWPDRPTIDAWLNRDMRKQVGLLLPDREIGLAAHDFQQGIAAKEVFLTRSVRDADSETVPSRWLNRIQSLLLGLPDSGGPAALKAMQARGQRYIDWAEALDAPRAPVERAPRPSPRPPVEARPKRLAVTRMTQLVRDPYHIYASHILRLRRLEAFCREPDARARGTLLHRIFERFLRAEFPEDPRDAEALLESIGAEEFAGLSAFPVLAAGWKSAFETIVPTFVAAEIQRRTIAQPYPPERWGELELPDLGFTLHAIADRIDRTSTGSLIIYDYKSGAPSSEKVINHFDRQLLLEAVIAEHGGFKDVATAGVDHVAYLGIGANHAITEIALTKTDKRDFRPETVLSDLRKLVESFQTRARGYTARRAAKQTRFDGDFDHLSRYGEWDESDPANPEDVG